MQEIWGLRKRGIRASICKACKGRVSVSVSVCVSEPKCVMSCVIVFVLDMQD